MIPTIDYDIDSTSFNQIYDLEVGAIIRYTKNVESLLIRIEADKPNDLDFLVRTVDAGTPTYTLYGDKTLIVTKRELIPEPEEPET